MRTALMVCVGQRMDGWMYGRLFDCSGTYETSDDCASHTRGWYVSRGNLVRRIGHLLLGGQLTHYCRDGLPELVKKIKCCFGS